MRARRTLIRNKAQELLEQLGISEPPVNLYTVAASLGIEIQKSVPSTKDEELSGFLFRDKTKNLSVIGINKKHHRNRRRFTAAHEIGHFLLHKSSSTYVDRRFVVNLRSSASSEGTNVEEIEANLFAAELLMPYNMIKKDMEEIGALDIFCDGDKVISGLAEKYEVSNQAITYRLANLGYIDISTE